MTAVCRRESGNKEKCNINLLVTQITTQYPVSLETLDLSVLTRDHWLLPEPEPGAGPAARGRTLHAQTANKWIG